MLYGYDEMLEIERELQEEAWREDGELTIARKLAEKEWAMEAACEDSMPRDYEPSVPVIEVKAELIVEDDDIPF